MLRRPATIAWTAFAACVIAAGVLALVGQRAAAADRMTLEVPFSETTRVPETGIALTYEGVGHAMMMDGGCRPFVSWRVDNPITGTSSADGLVGMRLGPWRVARVEGEWGGHEVAPTWWDRAAAFLSGGPPPDPRPAALLELERVPSP